MEPYLLRILSILMGFLFLGAAFFAFKKGKVSLHGDDHSSDFEKKDNPIGFWFTVIIYIFFGVMSFYLSFKL
tara:strand:- start:153 stop:368 length:216 start_codon:yes stop_codon:yes gene_type:complete